jgi:hypothetical protein
VIVQVPAGFGDVSGTWEDFSGPPTGPKPLVIQTGLTSLPVQPGVMLDAEPGHELVVIDFPVTPGNAIMWNVDFKMPAAGGMQAPPMKVKVMLAAKAEVGGQAYYLPTFPCVSVFATVPEVEIPAGTSGGPPSGLLTALTAAIAQAGAQPCNNEVYAFAPVTTTMLPSAEDCANCLDDDGNGLVDYDDPACCGGSAPAGLVLKRARLKAGKGVLQVPKAGAVGVTLGFAKPGAAAACVGALATFREKKGAVRFP